MSELLFTWPAAQNPPPQDQRSPRLLSASFGDGYGQELPDGINHDRQQWTVSFVRPVAEIAALESFLAARGGWDPFYWINPRGELIRVKCKQWTRAWSTPRVASTSATLVQEFDAVIVPSSIDGIVNSNPILVG